VAGCSSIDFLDADVEGCGAAAAAPERLRIATWNIHGGYASSLEEVQEVLAGIDADVLALQEVNRGVSASGADVDQDLVLADALGYEHVAYLGADERGGGVHGDGLLSRFPLARAERRELRSGLHGRQRSALDVDVCFGARPVRLIAAHNDWVPWGSLANTRSLADLAAETAGEGTILIGDLNQLPWWRGIDQIEEAGMVSVAPADEHTYIGDLWKRTLDYAFVDAVVEERVLGFGLEDTRASDHLPLWFEVDAAALE
jgi:endonuclease/exonuclease/phosphatase family metal-dependent hydrolase